MDDSCKHCYVCCKLIPVDFNRQNIIRDGLQPLDEDFMNFLAPVSIEEAHSINDYYVTNVQNCFPDAEFFRCIFLNEENVCTNPSMHDFCIKYPSHPLALIPDECNFYGEIFIKSEELKQKIRKYKEEIVFYESMIASNPKEEMSYRKIITSLQRFVDKYLPFGSEEW